jgi:hypothetical protein
VQTWNEYQQESSKLEKMKASVVVQIIDSMSKFVYLTLSKPAILRNSLVILRPSSQCGIVVCALIPKSVVKGIHQST